MLQTRNGKRTAHAAVKIAVDMVKDQLIDKATAVTRLEPEQIDQLLHPMFDKKELAAAASIAKGLPASPGAACGQIYFTAADAAAAAETGVKVILVREETSPEDLAGMVAAEGILTARGGMTSHAVRAVYIHSSLFSLYIASSHLHFLPNFLTFEKRSFSVNEVSVSA